jgi:hypothetical protein
VSVKIVRGVSPFSGVGEQWYAWAGVPHKFTGEDGDDPGGTSYSPYEEGAIRPFKWWAWLDTFRLARKVRKQL